MPTKNSRLSKPLCKWFDHSPAHRAYLRKKSRRVVAKKLASYRRGGR